MDYGQRALLAILLAAAAAAQAFATDYSVGDSQGWTSGVDYDSWASGKTFKVGDTLLFQYALLHSVAQVSQSDYSSCSSGSNAIKTSTNGNTKITITAPGNHYFVCGTPGHCSGGMKLAITAASADFAPATPGDATPASSSKPGGSSPSDTATPSTSEPSILSPPATLTYTKENGAGRSGGGKALAAIGTALFVIGLTLML